MTGVTSPAALAQRRHLLARVGRAIFKKPGLGTAVIYGGLIFFFLLAAIGPSIGPWLQDVGCGCGWGPEELDPTHSLEPMNARHLLGTDASGHDIFSRLLASPRVNLVIAFVAAFLSVAIGVPLGLIAGYSVGRGRAASLLSELIMRAQDVLQSFPIFVFAMVLVAVAGQSTQNVIIAMTIVNLPAFARLARAEILTTREQPYADAARILGHSNVWIIFRHLGPNSVASTLATMPVVMGFVVLFTASLSFVGAGVPVTTPELGGMISRGAGNMVTGEWWPSVFPGIALGVLVLTFAFAAQDIATRMRTVKRGESGAIGAVAETRAASA